jgi:hypothetical protein
MKERNRKKWKYTKCNSSSTALLLKMKMTIAIVMVMTLTPRMMAHLLLQAAQMTNPTVIPPSLSGQRGILAFFYSYHIPLLFPIPSLFRPFVLSYGRAKTIFPYYFLNRSYHGSRVSNSNLRRQSHYFDPFAPSDYPHSDSNDSNWNNGINLNLNHKSLSSDHFNDNASFVSAYNTDINQKANVDEINASLRTKHAAMSKYSLNFLNPIVEEDFSAFFWTTWSSQMRIGISLLSLFLATLQSMHIIIEKESSLLHIGLSKSTTSISCF